MKKICCLLTVLLLLSALALPAAAMLPDREMVLLAEPCSHPEYIRYAEKKVRCVYVSGAVHARQTCTEALCTFCRNDTVTIVDAQVLEPHAYACVDDYCDPENHLHIYIYECSGCRARDEASQVCNGLHAVD